MALRLRRTASAAGLGEQELTLVDECYWTAIAKRARAFPEPHPDFLHPARTALILLTDLQVRDCSVLCAALLFDSRDAALSTSAQEAAGLGFHYATELLAHFPEPGLDDSELIESLITLEPRALNVVLAERLDHARHLQFRPEDQWAGFHRQILEVYLPIAYRSATLVGRFDAWAEAFGRRLHRIR